MDKEIAQQKITELVEKFCGQWQYYEGAEYNETQCREDFINPLFAALGWDVENKENLSPTYRSVRLENRLVKDGASRSTDYSFWIGSGRVFIVEAKKPSINLKEGKVADQAAFQLRRYGWSANLAVSVVTNFKELAVYDCTKKPHEKDKASTARLNFLTLEDYTGRQKSLGDIRPGFDYLWDIFGYENVRRGGLEKYIQTDERKKGILTVDDSFLQFLEDWRQEFATSIFRNNKDLTEWELNVGVQQILDRVVFLRFAEDREIEQIGNLLKALNTQEFGGVYKNLYRLFEQADDKYNAGLFDTSKDTVARKIIVDNKLLKDFVKGLYYPGPYDFQAMPVEVLGSAYERFLGKTIRIHGRYAKVEEKPEVRKAGGVYYTPQYIIDYIVENTVGKVIEGKTPKEVSKITIVDPACGSGSFLLGAYQFLLNWHQDYYARHNPPSKGHKSDPLTPDGKLTIEEKKRILLNNIFGVDIDVIAVEFAKLSLLLKCMEGESAATLQRLKVYHEKMLPNIDGNIRCGNSLIGTDIYLAEGGEDFSEKEQFKINALDWHREFANIIKNGGADIIIGNPPYVRPHNIDPIFKKYFWQHYKTFTAKSDLYAVFMEKVLTLLKDGAMFGYIVSSTYFGLESFTTLRKILLENTIHHLTIPKSNVFKDSTVETSVIIASKLAPTEKNIIRVDSFDSTRTYSVKQASFHGNHNCIFDISVGFKLDASKFRTLSDVVNFYYGLKTADDEKFITRKQKSKKYKPLLTRSDFGRYETKYAGYYVWYRPELMKQNKQTARPGEPFRFENDKIIVMDIAKKIVAQIDTQKYYVKDALIFHAKDKGISLKFILGVLNSKLLTYLYANSFLGICVAKNAILQLPFPHLDISKESDKKKHDEIVRLVERMLALKKKERVNLESGSHKIYHRQIVAIDAEIDRLVYQLYGLTAEEIAIVEEEK